MKWLNSPAPLASLKAITYCLFKLEVIDYSFRLNRNKFLWLQVSLRSHHFLEMINSPARFLDPGPGLPPTALCTLSHGERKKGKVKLGV